MSNDTLKIVFIGVGFLILYLIMVGVETIAGNELATIVGGFGSVGVIMAVNKLT